MGRAHAIHDGGREERVMGRPLKMELPLRNDRVVRVRRVVLHRVRDGGVRVALYDGQIMGLKRMWSGTRCRWLCIFWSVGSVWL